MSYRIIKKHLAEIEYQKDLPRTMLMLTINYKHKHIE